VLPEVKRKRQRVIDKYMKYFHQYYEEDIIRKRVERRNEDIGLCFGKGQAKLLEKGDAVRKWKDQGGRCGLCTEMLQWSGDMKGRGSTPEIDRIDVPVGTYSGNFLWLCRYCNGIKGLVSRDVCI
jgi:hypothetical protein